MPIDTKTPKSPGWWFDRLGRKLYERQRDIEMLQNYYDGNPPLPSGAKSAREAYAMFQRKARANYARLIVEAVRQKMIVTGFRTGSEEHDQLALRIWEGNQLGADQTLVHRSQLALRDAYVIVGPPEDGDDIPVITIEDPRQVITEHDPLRPRRRIAALKVYVDEGDAKEYAYLYLPGVIHRAERPWRRSRKEGASWSAKSWEWADPIDEDGLTVVQTTPSDDIYVVRFANDPNLSGDSCAEFEPFIDTLNRINHMILQRMMIATLQAFRQRAVKGVPIKDENGNDIDYDGLFAADPGALWLLPETAEMWESGQVDLTPILEAVQADVKELASISQTPLYQMSSDSVNQSAEGASLTREGHTAKVNDRTGQAGESWEEVQRLAFIQAGVTDPPRDMETLWKPPESYSITERASAATAAKAAGVPWETVMADIMGYSRQQIARMKTQRTDDQVLEVTMAAQQAAAAAPVASPTQPPSAS